MATVTGFTAARMLQIENGTVVDGDVVAGELILVTRGGTQINAGSVQGPTGSQGPKGDPGTAGEKLTTGMLADFPKTPLPAGWLECNGAVYNIADYPDLGAYLGGDYGGNGTTTFAVPTYVGRVRISRDSSQTEFDMIGKVGGEKAHVLSVAELPLHSHPHNLAAPQHVHDFTHTHPAPGGGYVYSDYATQISLPGGAGGRLAGYIGYPNPATTGGATALALTGGIQNTGSGAGHNVLQPYRVVVCAIKT